MQSKVIQLEGWPLELHVILDATVKEKIIYVEKQYGMEVANKDECFFDDKQPIASFASFGCGIYLMFIELSKEYSLIDYAGLIAHELIHLLWQLQADIGTIASQEVQEPQAYLMQTLLAKVLEFVKENTTKLESKEKSEEVPYLTSFGIIKVGNAST
jgi:hypothetical protein